MMARDWSAVRQAEANLVDKRVVEANVAQREALARELYDLGQALRWLNGLGDEPEVMTAIKALGSLVAQKQRESFRLIGSEE